MLTTIVRASAVALVTSALAACQAQRGKETAHSESAVASAPVASAPAAAELNTALAPSSAKLGAEAPDFTLPDLDGHSVHLASFRGKTVVLEWFNPECPFVNKSHTKGSLVNTAARQTKAGVVWLAINSAAPGRQGHGADVNRAGASRFHMDYPILLDENGRVGRAYGAAHTPHLYVIDPAGKLIYRGAIDNSPDGEGESAPDGKLVNYVDAALADLSAGRPVATADTEAYGCAVKYAK